MVDKNLIKACALIFVGVCAAFMLSPYLQTSETPSEVSSVVVP
ncbi:hypothetical protein [Zooshikella harenae]|nr:hypothetical protein [Zooshikella harenae]